MAPGPGRVQISFPRHAAALLDSLNRLRLEGKFCDVAVHVGGRVFPAHKSVLAAASPFFHDKLVLQAGGRLALPPAIDAGAFEGLLELIYCGRLSVAAEALPGHLLVASGLQMWHVVDRCSQILRDVEGKGSPSAWAARGGDGASAAAAARAVRGHEGSSSSWSVRGGDESVRGLDGSLSSSSSSSRGVRAREGSPSSSSRAVRAPDGSSRAHRGREGPARVVRDGPSSSSSSSSSSWTLRGGAAAARLSRGGEGPSSSSSSSLSLWGSRGDSGIIRDDDDGIIHGDNRIIHDDSGIIHGDSGIVHGDNEIVHGDSRIICGDNGITHGDDGPSSSSWAASATEDVLQIRVAASPSPPPPPAPAEEILKICVEEDEDDDDDDDDEGPGSAGALRIVLEDSADAAAAREPPKVFYVKQESGAAAAALVPSADPPPPPYPAPPNALLLPPAGWKPVDLHGNEISGRAGALHAPVKLGPAPADGKRFGCACGKRFAVKPKRDRHIMLTLSLRPFACGTCHKRFKLKHHLTEHMKTHDGARGACQGCGRRFRLRSGLAKHRALCPGARWGGACWACK